MTTNALGYRDYLQRSFKSRINTNPAYSLRAFARDIGLHPARLSMVLSKKQGHTHQKLERLLQHV